MMNAGIANVKNNFDYWIETLNLPPGEICAGIKSQAIFALGNVTRSDEIKQAAVGVCETLADQPPAVARFHLECHADALSGTPERCVENMRGNR